MDQLKYKIIEESVRGGAAYYRSSHQATNEYAKYQVEAHEARQLIRGKVVCIKLPRVFAIIRLPGWSPIGTLLK